MEIIIIGIIGLLVFLLFAPVVALLRSKKSAQDIEYLQYKLQGVEVELTKLKTALEELKTAKSEAPEAPPSAAAQEVPAKKYEPFVAPPVLSMMEQVEPPPIPAALSTSFLSDPVVQPPPVERPPYVKERPPIKEPPRVERPAINWEQFMGVKLFAWIGGLALFIGVALFLKYSFENNLVPPSVRAAMGFVVGLGLVVGGIFLSNKKYTVTSQTLCATGVVILYAVTFACRAVYHFPIFSHFTTFVLMVLITGTAFFLAVRMNALVVAVLGMLGGFLTPVMLSTGQDNPFGLFAYVALLDAGLIAVALHRRWHFLSLMFGELNQTTECEKGTPLSVQIRVYPWLSPFPNCIVPAKDG